MISPDTKSITNAKAQMSNFEIKVKAEVKVKVKKL